MLLSGENVVAAGDVFISYLHQGIKKQDNMTSKAFKVCTKILKKLYEDLNTKVELTIGNREIKLTFSMPFLLTIKKVCCTTERLFTTVC